MSSQHWPAPRLPVAFALFLLLAFALFLRSPGSTFVYDEQEALLGNPFLWGHRPFAEAFSVDFWGRSRESSIGSYRPLPLLLWRSLAATLRFSTPFGLQLLNPLVHALVGLCLYAVLRRWRVSLSSAFAASLFFVVAAVAAEAVASVVGLADLLVGLFSLLALLSLELPVGLRELTVFASCVLGLLSKETMLGVLPLLVVAALCGPASKPWSSREPCQRRWFTSRRLRALGAMVATVAALGLFVLVRRRWFLADQEPQAPVLTLGRTTLAALVAWFGQPHLPVDPQYNPLLLAAPWERFSTALGIVFAGFVQLWVPWNLCADYSFPREVARSWDVRAWLGATCILVPLVWGGFRLVRLCVRRLSSTRPELPALALLWLPLTALPSSNLLVLLPTIRAERLLYLPLIGAALGVGLLLERLPHTAPMQRALTFCLLTSAAQARAHSLHYESDVLFWRATSRGAPASAKSHLNLGVMLGARRDFAGRLRETRLAAEMAPNWPLAHVYVGDALCRAGKPDEALPHYLRGLEARPTSKELSALALQCLWDAGRFEAARPALAALAEAAPESWFAHLFQEISARGAEHLGLPVEYRPRGYNQSAPDASRRHIAP